MLSLSNCKMLVEVLLTPWTALRDSETARDFEDRFDDEEPLDSLIQLCTGFVVIQILRANFSSALNASHGVICNEEWRRDFVLENEEWIHNFIRNRNQMVPCAVLF